MLRTANRSVFSTILAVTGRRDNNEARCNPSTYTVTLRGFQPNWKETPYCSGGYNPQYWSQVYYYETYQAPPYSPPGGGYRALMVADPSLISAHPDTVQPQQTGQQSQPIAPRPADASLISAHPNTVQPAAAAAAAAPPPLVINIESFAFLPVNNTMRVPVGTNVTWVNKDPVPHTSTSDVSGQADSWDSGILQPGHNFTHAFSKAGTFSYHCNIHPFMRGTLEVVQA